MVYLQLFLSFCKIGFTSFGGLSMIPLINSEMLSHSWMTFSQVSDIVAIAEMTPGPLGLNCATFAGMRVDGITGALAANLGIMAPTLTITAVAAFLFERFRKSNLMGRIMFGVRPVCIGIIWAVILNFSMTNYVSDVGLNYGSIFIGLLSMYLLLKRKLHITVVILIGAALGIFIC